MNSQYEIVFIMTPVLSDQQRKDAVKSYVKHIKGGGCEIVHEENWGLKKLAYPIQKKSTGYYFCIEFNGSGQVIPTLELSLKRDEKILRFLTVKLDKHAVAFNIKDRKKAKEKKDTPKEEEVKEESKATAETPKEANDAKGKEKIVAKESKKEKKPEKEQEKAEEAPAENKAEDSESEAPKEEVVNN